jgi:tetratricopeptide (TPR) repeat protein
VHFRAALQHFGEAVGLDPTNVEALIEAGSACEAMDDPASAIAAYGIAISAQPERVDILVKRAHLHRLEDHNDEAVADYTAAIRFEPDEPIHYRHRGEAHASADRHAEAVADFTRYLERTEMPDSSKVLDQVRISNRSFVLTERAEAHAELGNMEEALKDARQAVELDRDCSYARTVLAELRFVGTSIFEGGQRHRRGHGGSVPQPIVEVDVHE